MYPAGTLTYIETSHGLDEPIEVSVLVRLPPQLGESAIEQEVIGQLLMSVLPKNASQSEVGVIVTAAPPSV